MELVECRELTDARPRRRHENFGSATAVDLRLNGCRCLVTGANSGIGRATALALAGEGAELLLTALERDSLEVVAEECVRAGGRATCSARDLTAADAGERLADDCRERLGEVDVLVSCAGRTWYRAVRELTDEDLQAQWELNVMALARLLRAFAPSMAARGSGRIVVVSSVSAKQPSAVNIAYAATKVAQVALVRGFAEEYARDGVAINSVLPGPVDTPLWRAANAELADARGVTVEEIERATIEALPRGRTADTEELANVITFLASPAAANVIGAAWTVDGGSARQLF
jgi:3-oxoacyl-[acyl-carrier protein] reductase